MRKSVWEILGITIAVIVSAFGLLVLGVIILFATGSIKLFPNK